MMSDRAGQHVRLSAVPIRPNAHSGSAAAPTLFPTEGDEQLAERDVYSAVLRAVVTPGWMRGKAHHQASPSKWKLESLSPSAL